MIRLNAVVSKIYGDGSRIRAIVLNTASRDTMTVKTETNYIQVWRRSNTEYVGTLDPETRVRVKNMYEPNYKVRRLITIVPSRMYSGKLCMTRSPKGEIETFSYMNFFKGIKALEDSDGQS